ncbi:MAG: hypothetical protein WCP16_26600 [Pseudanabaena sp. ELA645]
MKYSDRHFIKITKQRSPILKNQNNAIAPSFKSPNSDRLSSF